MRNHDPAFLTFPDDPVNPGDMNGGITIREYMATHLLAALCSGTYPEDLRASEDRHYAAGKAIDLADALIAALNRPVEAKDGGQGNP